VPYVLYGSVVLAPSELSHPMEERVNPLRSVTHVIFFAAIFLTAAPGQNNQQLQFNTNTNFSYCTPGGGGQGPVDTWFWGPNQANCSWLDTASYASNWYCSTNPSGYPCASESTCTGGCNGTRTTTTTCPLSAITVNLLCDDEIGPDSSTTTTSVPFECVPC
jgi:hypothetical protein